METVAQTMTEDGICFKSFGCGPKPCELYETGNVRSAPYKDSGTDYDTG
jgi:hypothetical protein